MPIRYKVDVIAALKEAGYNTTRIRKDKIMGEAMLQKIRSGQMVSWATLETICDLLGCQPGGKAERGGDIYHAGGHRADDHEANN